MMAGKIPAVRKLLLPLLVLVASLGLQGQQPPRFEVQEATVATIQAEMKAGRLTCRALVDAYLRRIDAYDKNGPALNAIVLINPDALKEADALDTRYRTSGPAGPLHCVPTIVKDNFETIGLQSAAGSLSLKGFVSNKDAFLVKRIKEAGAIVLAKSNMAEFAFSPFETVNSILPGYTKNPYALDRVTAGSSGGTAAAVAANFGAIGLGSDTGNSIRGPSSHQALVGIRSTMGLTSRAGVIPLSYAGGHRRADGAHRRRRRRRVPSDRRRGSGRSGHAGARAATACPSRFRTILGALVRDGLKGARIGVLRQAYERDTTDPEIVSVFMTAIGELKRARRHDRRSGGRRSRAVTVRKAAVDAAGSSTTSTTTWRRAARRRRCTASTRSCASRQVPPVRAAAACRAREASGRPGPGTAACKAEADYREQFRAAVAKTMDAQKLDAFVYPTWSNPPRLIGDLNTPAGDNSQVFSPTTGFPAINVPMGYTRDGTLPAGITFFGRAWDEATLIKLAYAYEQATHHRHPPATTPPLR